MKRSLLHRLMFPALFISMSDGHGLGDGGPGGGDGNSGAKTDGGNNNNNPPPPLDPFANPAQNPSNAGGNNDNSTTNQPGNQNSPDDTLSKYMSGLNFMGDVDTDSLMEAVANNDPKAFAAGLQGMLANTYKLAITDANRIMQSQLETAKADASNTAQANINFQNGINEVVSRVPALAEPHNRPLVAPIMERFLKQTNGDMVKATESTAKYFQQLAQSLAPKQSGTGSPFRNDGPGGPQNTSNRRQDQSDEIDWTEVLAGKRSDG